VYHALRMHAPVHRMASGSVLVSRHADLEAIYKNTALFSSDKTVEFRPKFGDSPLYRHHTTSLVFNDGARHARVRRIMAGALTSRAIADMEAPVTALVDRLLDAMAEKFSAGSPVDLIDDFAAAIPIEVIGNMLAIPRDERGPLRDWSLAILGALEPTLTREQHERGNRAVTEFVAYLERLAPGPPGRSRQGRAHPAHPGRKRRQQAHGGRAAAELHFHSQRRPRDHDEPDRQWPRRLDGVARGEWSPRRRPVPHQVGRRGAVALRKLEPARQPARDGCCNHRRTGDTCRNVDHAPHRRGQPRSRAISGA
jgi:hypothetical protein